MRRFVSLLLKNDATPGLLLLLSAVLAMIVANMGMVMPESTRYWINDGLMVIFFLLIGMEIKREMVAGELSTREHALLPAIAAAGGMMVPAFIFAYYNFENPDHLRGWAIPSATDIAFSLGVLSLFGKRVPLALKVFLTAVAVFDDLGAILIIALCYSHDLSLVHLLFAAGFAIAMYKLNQQGVTRLLPYIVLGLALWIAVLHSGVHATVAGVLIGFLIPLRAQNYRGNSPARELEIRLHPWVNYGILPLFAFANAGVVLSGVTLSSLMSHVPMGIALGLFAGKQIGVFVTTVLMVSSGWGAMPRGTTWPQIYAVSIIAGIGFTMSLFIGLLAYSDPVLTNYTRLGVMVGSLGSVVAGYIALQLTLPKQAV